MGVMDEHESILGKPHALSIFPAGQVLPCSRLPPMKVRRTPAVAVALKLNLKTL
jgi:hypothetical protein